MCDSGKWHCSANFCPATCVIEGHFVTTIDGKHYTVPGKCTYVASQVILPSFPLLYYKIWAFLFATLTSMLHLFQGYNWTVIIEFYKTTPTLKTVVLHLFQVPAELWNARLKSAVHAKCDAFDFICRKCTRSRTPWWKLERRRSLSFTRLVTAVDDNTYLLKIEETILSTRVCLCLDHALVFWESSMYVQVHTSFGLKIQVQVSPQIQLYLTPPANHTGPISGQPLKSKLGLAQLEPAVMAFTLPLRSLWKQQQRHHGWLHHE